MNTFKRRMAWGLFIICFCRISLADDVAKPDRVIGSLDHPIYIGAAGEAWSDALDEWVRQQGLRDIPYNYTQPMPDGCKFTLYKNKSNRWVNCNSYLDQYGRVVFVWVDRGVHN